MVFDPMSSAIASLGVPLCTGTPLTVIVAVLSLAVGVTVRFSTAFSTHAVYVVVSLANVGVSVPCERVRSLSAALSRLTSETCLGPSSL